MLTRFSQQGFSLIELFTAITIIALLMALGMPSLSAYLQGARLGAGAKSYYTGVNLARSEAVRRNARVEFVLTQSPIAAGIENSLVPSTTGQNWVVRAQPSASDPYVLIEAKTALEGAGSATSPVTATATASTIVFGSLGQSMTGPVSISLENPSMGACVMSGGPVRCFDVRVLAGGQTRLCTPVASAVTGDTRNC